MDSGLSNIPRILFPFSFPEYKFSYCSEQVCPGLQWIRYQGWSTGKNMNSADADGGPRSRVCSRDTPTQPPIDVS